MAEYLGTAQISFAQLVSGQWGVRVATKGALPNPGDTVVVRKANGEHKRVTLGRVVSTDRGAFPAPATYYAIQRGGGGRQQRRTDHRDAKLAQVTIVGRAARNELDAALAAQADYDPADFEYFDGEHEIQAAHEARLQRRVDEAQAAVDALRRLYVQIRDGRTLRVA